jgi:pyridoxal phosphate enzyme (YggS family)
MLKENLNIVLNKINEAKLRSGRETDQITLVAVSKTEPLRMIEELISYGVTDFGENKAQEFRDKFNLLKDSVNWHFIGHLQKNKIKYVVGKAALIHSVDSVELAAAIDEKAKNLGVVQNILLEYNTSGEESKFGIRSEDDLKRIAEYCVDLKNVKLLGLMTMAPFTDDEKAIRSSFYKLKATFDNLNNDGFSLTELSMGMTNDFEIAIEEGSTIVRIGTAIFGERDYSKPWNAK